MCSSRQIVQGKGVFQSFNFYFQLPNIGQVSVQDEQFFNCTLNKWSICNLSATHISSRNHLFRQSHTNMDSVCCWRLYTCSCLDDIDSCSFSFFCKHTRTQHCRASSSPSLTRWIYNAARDHACAARSTFTCQGDWLGCQVRYLSTPTFPCRHKK